MSSKSPSIFSLIVPIDERRLPASRTQDGQRFNA
jgi:hypothetical protein